MALHVRWRARRSAAPQSARSPRRASRPAAGGNWAHVPELCPGRHTNAVAFLNIYTFVTGLLTVASCCSCFLVSLMKGLQAAPWLTNTYLSGCQLPLQITCMATPESLAQRCFCALHRHLHTIIPKHTQPCMPPGISTGTQSNHSQSHEQSRSNLYTFICTYDCALQRPLHLHNMDSNFAVAPQHASMRPWHDSQTYYS